jgi:hypothetical protein
MQPESGRCKNMFLKSKNVRAADAFQSSQLPAERTKSARRAHAERTQSAAMRVEGCWILMLRGSGLEPEILLPYLSKTKTCSA